jgi:hypothetical protein
MSATSPTPRRIPAILKEALDRNVAQRTQLDSAIKIFRLRRVLGLTMDEALARAEAAFYNSLKTMTTEYFYTMQSLAHGFMTVACEDRDLMIADRERALTDLDKTEVSEIYGTRTSRTFSHDHTSYLLFFRLRHGVSMPCVVLV